MENNARGKGHLGKEEVVLGGLMGEWCCRVWVMELHEGYQAGEGHEGVWVGLGAGML